LLTIMRIETAQGSVEVYSSGTGPGLVLLHANGGEHRDFDAIRPPLAASYRVHAIDWPGHGSSGPVHQATSLAFAELLPSLLEALDGGPFVVIGNSIGGFAAARCAASHPDLIRALVLVSPAGCTPQWFGTDLACRIIGSRQVAPWAMRTLPRLYLRGDGDMVRTVRERARSTSINPAAQQTFRSIWNGFPEREHTLRHVAAGVNQPVLLAWGRLDPILPWLVDGRRARRWFPQADVRRFSCGHQPYVEQPKQFLDAFDSFMLGLSS
jgi:pimeloyl-ACP methyl ester carboxylesterase